MFCGDQILTLPIADDLLKILCLTHPHQYIVDQHIAIHIHVKIKIQIIQMIRQRVQLTARCIRRRIVK